MKIGERVSLNTPLTVGFGRVRVMKDDEVIYSGGTDDPEFAPQLRDYEAMAKKAPNHVWICEFEAPLWGEIYHRKGNNNWVLIHTNNGFA